MTQPESTWRPTDPALDALEAGPKLPRPEGTGDAATDAALLKAWAQHIKGGLTDSQRVFGQTLKMITRGYWISFGLHVLTFLTGLGLLIAAVVVSLIAGEWRFGMIFGGLGLGVFLTFFLTRPLQALEENLQFVAWLGVAYNTYWTRVLVAQDAATAQATIKDAQAEFTAGITALIDKHAALRANRPASTLPVEK